jgi:outer membrane protein TolC
VRFDDDRQRLEVGQISPVDLKEAEARYQRRRTKRNASDQRRRTSRARLAIAMNQPDKLPSELAEPALAWAKAPLPSIEALKDIMARHNSALHEVESLVAASRHRLEAIRAERRPSLDVDLEAAAYTRELNGRDDLRAGVVLTWPLHQGVRVDARLAREDALLRRLEAQRDALRMELEETLLETALEVEYLRGTAIPAAMAEMEFRDLALERARGEYETERKTNLGDSMAATMEAALGLRRAEYRLALAVARIEALIGRPLDRLSVGVSDTGVP